jgi:hypothetical protein
MGTHPPPPFSLVTGRTRVPRQNLNDDGGEELVQQIRSLADHVSSCCFFFCRRAVQLLRQADRRWPMPHLWVQLRIPRAAGALVGAEGDGP